MKVALLVLLVVAQVLDVITTLRVLAAGGREANPIMRALMGAMGTRTALVASKVLVIVLAAVWLQQLPVVALAGACLAYAVIVGHNWGVLRRLQASRPSPADSTV